MERKVGKATSVNWPVGLGGKGNEGVSALIEQTPGAIGYIELIYAIQNHMPYGKVQEFRRRFREGGSGQRFGGGCGRGQDHAR